MIIAIIPAKGGSNRFPNKNMVLLNGNPMIYYSIKVAHECSLIDKVYVSTDSDEIEEYARQQGAEVIRRGVELAGEAPVVAVYIHAIKQINNPDIKIIAGVQPDHPDRNASLIDAINYCIKKNYDEVITVDEQGTVNGSLKIMTTEALLSGRIGAVGTLMDDCTNVHYESDLKQAEKNMKIRKAIK